MQSSPLFSSETFPSFSRENSHLPPTSPRQLLAYFLSLRMCLFWTRHMSGITHRAASHVWLLSLSSVSSGPSTLQRVSEFPSFLWPSDTPVCAGTAFCHSFVRRGTFGLCELRCYERGCALPVFPTDLESPTTRGFRSVCH